MRRWQSGARSSCVEQSTAARAEERAQQQSLLVEPIAHLVGVASWATMRARLDRGFASDRVVVRVEWGHDRAWRRRVVSLPGAPLHRRSVARAADRSFARPSLAGPRRTQRTHQHDPANNLLTTSTRADGYHAPVVLQPLFTRRTHPHLTTPATAKTLLQRERAVRCSCSIPTWPSRSTDDT